MTKVGKSNMLDAKRFDFTTEMVCTDTHVYFVTLEGELVGLNIEHRGIAKTIRQLFDLAWENYKK
jgi:hypothetical protein